jgi:hypothetical protein
LSSLPESPTSDKLARAFGAFAQRQAQYLGRQQHILEEPAPFEQQRLLEHHADVAGRVERVARRADLRLAAVGALQPGENFQQRGLAATRRSDEAGEFARCHREGRIGNGGKFPALLAIDLAHIAQPDEGLGHGGTHLIRASRTMTRRSSPRTSQ